MRHIKLFEQYLNESPGENGSQLNEGIFRQKGKLKDLIKNLFKKVDEIVDGLSRDHREIAEYRDIIELLEKQGIILNDEEEDIVIYHLRDKYEIY